MCAKPKRSGYKMKRSSKGAAPAPKPVTRDNGFTGTVDGTDLTNSGTLSDKAYQSSPDAIMYVMDAQGFRGKPKIITDQAEFDKAVAAAWDGNGLELTRGIGAPDQQTLDAYKKTLTDGEWYVSCGGGAVHGYGQYATYTYGGKASETMLRSAQRYADRHARWYDYETQTTREGSTHVFRMTLDPSARIISEGELERKMYAHNNSITAYSISNAKRTKASYPQTLLDQLSKGTRAEKAAAKAWADGQFGAQPRRGVSDAYKSQYGEAMKKLQQATKHIKVPQRFTDLGVFGAAAGYDFYYDSITGYSVTLNRSKLIVFEG